MAAVKLKRSPVLTTQLYSLNEPQNASDGIFSPELLMEMQETAEGQQAAFDFVLDIG